jgi:hypothetical protein
MENRILFLCYCCDVLPDSERNASLAKSEMPDYASKGKRNKSYNFIMVTKCKNLHQTRISSFSSHTRSYAITLPVQTRSILLPPLLLPSSLNLGTIFEHSYTMGMRALILLLLIAVTGYAREYPHCTYTYFKNGKIATSQCYDTNNRWGRAKAFDKQGKEIYDKELRRIAGHSSVQFTFYESGAVKTAYWSSAPDAGIQWYRTNTSFSEDGKITSETEDNYDKGPGVVAPKSPGYVTKPRPSPVKPAPSTTMECAVIYSSEFWFKNTTPYSVVVTATRKSGPTETYTLTLRPRQTMKAGQMIGAQIFYTPADYYNFSVKPLKESLKQRFIILPSDQEPENTKKEVRRYYYDVRRVI